MKTCPTCGDVHEGSAGCPAEADRSSSPETYVAYPPPVDPAHAPQPEQGGDQPAEAAIKTPPEQPLVTGRGNTNSMSDEELARPISGVMEPGTVWGSYRLLKLLGKGGMGEVYLAEHRKLGRKVALKLLRSRYLTDRDAVKRFFREARIVNQIRHANIVEITDFIENDAGSSYFIMELLEGQTLGKRRASQGILPVSETIEIALQICDALTAIHAAGVVHRDLKPDNVFLTMSMKGGADLVKLLDFGLVKVPEPARDESRLDTNPETLLGTPEYMSPEQIRGLSDVDHRSDLYSLGTILYECVSGVRPLTAPTFGELLVNIVTEEPTPPSQIEIGETPQLPPGLEELIMSCLAKDPDDRPSSAAVIREALVAIVEGHGETLNLPSRASQRHPARLRRRVLLAGAGAALALLTLGGVLIQHYLAVDHRPGRDPAQPAVKTFSHRQGQPIAHLSEMWRQVQHRPREGSGWQLARREMGLQHLDALRTGGAARAQVTFNRGGQLDVEEESEILIEEPGPPPGGGPAPHLARVRKGTIRVVAQPGTPIRLVTPDGKSTEVAALGDAPVSFRVIKGERGLELAVLKGAAQVRVGGRSLDLEQDQLVEVTDGQLGSPLKLPGYPELLDPAVDAQLIQGRKVSVRWQAVPGVTRYRFQLSHFIGFDNRLVDRITNTSSIELDDLKVETYIWRVRSVDEAGHEGEFGYARRFTVLPGGAPAEPADKRLLSPAPGAVIEYAKRAEPVTFRWRRGGKLHEVVLARSPDLKRFVVSRSRIPGTSVTLTEIDPGVYYWGVYVIKGRNRTALFAQARRFVIVQRTPPSVQVPAIKWK